jgi:hypothetical protein
VEKENATIQSFVIKPHLMSDTDPFDQLLDNDDHIDELLSNPEVISVIQHHLMAIADAVPKYEHDDDTTIELVLEALQSEMITPEEQALTSFTRRKLKTLSTWDGPSGWLAAEKRQLDQFHNIKMFGPPWIHHGMLLFFDLNGLQESRPMVLDVLNYVPMAPNVLLHTCIMVPIHLHPV